MVFCRSSLYLSLRTKIFICIHVHHANMCASTAASCAARERVCGIDTGCMRACGVRQNSRSVSDMRSLKAAEPGEAAADCGWRNARTA